MTGRVDRVLPSDDSATGSRRIDRAIFVALLLLVIASAPRILAYHRSAQLGPTTVRLVAVGAAGERFVLAVPQSIPDARIRVVAERIHAFVETPAGRALVPPQGRLEWALSCEVVVAGQRHVRRTVLVTPD